MRPEGLRLTLLRHAQADPALPGQRDWDRALTRRGMVDAEEMALRLKATRPAPPLIVSSPATRARQTAEIFLKALPKAQLRFIEELYLADVKALLSVVQQQLTPGHLLLVGHNPGLGELADLLCDERCIEGMPTASWVSMRFTAQSWQAVRAGAGIEAEFEYPHRQV